MDEVMPADLHHYLENSMERMTRSANESEGCNLVQPHWDPRFRAHRPAYLRLMKHLMRVGLVIAVETVSAHEQVGMFLSRRQERRRCA